MGLKGRKPRRPARREPPISLRICKLVTGKSRVSTRVNYIVDPCNADDWKAIPEQVVLSRWRRRKSERLSARMGVRLPPSTWRALGVILPDDPALWKDLDEDDIRGFLARKKRTLRVQHLRAPAAEAIVAMIRIPQIGPRVTRKLIERHSDPEIVDPRRPGVPDLFLWALDRDDRPCAPRFVEVKRPDERLSRQQREELQFLRSLGLKAGVFRLLER